MINDQRLARDVVVVEPGRIYLAPRDQHMLIESGQIRLSRGPRQHHTRPAVDPLFVSAAAPTASAWWACCSRAAAMTGWWG